MRVTEYNHRYVVSLTKREMALLRTVVERGLRRFNTKKLDLHDRFAFERWEGNPLERVDRVIDRPGRYERRR